MEQIQEFSDCSLSPTFQIFENFIIEIVKQFVENYWVKHFQKCYKNEFASMYFCSINLIRHVINNNKYFNHYFTFVSDQLLESF